MYFTRITPQGDWIPIACFSTDAQCCLNTLFNHLKWIRPFACTICFPNSDYVRFSGEILRTWAHAHTMKIQRNGSLVNIEWKRVACLPRKFYLRFDLYLPWVDSPLCRCIVSVLFSSGDFKGWGEKGRGMRKEKEYSFLPLHPTSFAWRKQYCRLVS